VVEERSKTIQVTSRAAFMPVISTASCPRLFRLHCPACLFDARLPPL
jgi:hypothetical protein